MLTFSHGNICYSRETSSFVRTNSNFWHVPSQENITECVDNCQLFPDVIVFMQ